jgi:hypothetical protein
MGGPSSLVGGPAHEQLHTQLLAPVAIEVAADALDKIDDVDKPA